MEEALGHDDQSLMNILIAQLYGSGTLSGERTIECCGVNIWGMEG